MNDPFGSIPHTSQKEEPEPVAAIVLAAGMSTRMGRLKMLLPFGEKPMLARILETLLGARNISPVIVVTGYAEEEIGALLDIYTVIRAHNADYAAGGMLSSVQTGVRALPRDGAGFFLVLGDQPGVRVETLSTLVETWRAHDAPIALPTREGRRGHPVLFASRCAAEILALTPGETLKTVVAHHNADILEVPVSDPAVLADVDTPEDYERALCLWRAAQRE